MGWFDSVVEAVTAPVQAATQVAAAPIQATAQIVKGGDPAAPIIQATKVAGGTAVATATGPTGIWARSQSGQDVLMSSEANKWTLGSATNYGGFENTAATLQRGGDPTQADWDRSRKYLTTVAVIGGGAYAVGKAGGPGAAADKIWAGAKTVTPTEALLGLTVSDRLARGDLQGAVGAAGLPGYLNNYLPGSGDWLNNLLPDGGSYPSSTFGGVPPVFPGADEGQYYDASAAPAKPSETLKKVAAVLAVIGVAYISARKL